MFFQLFFIFIFLINYLHKSKTYNMFATFKQKIMANENQPIEETPGYQIAIAFKPFIDPKCSEHIEIVKDMAKSINRAVKSTTELQQKHDALIMRVKQFLTALDFDKLTVFEAKCALALVKELYL